MSARAALFWPDFLTFPRGMSLAQSVLAQVLAGPVGFRSQKIYFGGIDEQAAYYGRLQQSVGAYAPRRRVQPVADDDYRNGDDHRRHGRLHGHHVGAREHATVGLGAPDRESVV